MTTAREIRRYCDAIAAAFKPRKIILFGSHAHGQPNEHSDVDVMVVMPKKRYRRDLDFQMRMKVPAGFPVDILVEPDDKLARRIADGECFVLDITENGKVMYEEVHA